MCPVRAVNAYALENRGGDPVIALERACLSKRSANAVKSTLCVGTSDPVRNVLENRCASDVGSEIICRPS